MLLLFALVNNLRSLRRFLPVLFAAALSCGAVSPAPASAQSSSSSVASADTTYPLAVGHRDVLVSLPANHDPARAYPVLLVFGGRGASPEEVARTTGLRPGSDAIIAYARGVDNAWAGAPYALTGMAEDVSYARAIVDSVAAQHPVDRSRVGAVGHSNGGAFALALACRAPDLLSGAVSVSGMFYEPVDAGCLSGGVPVMLIHAGNDDVALIDGGVRHGAPFHSAGEIFQRWGARNHCLPVTVDRSTAGPDLSHRAWTGCHAETDMVVSASAGHPWPAHASALARDFLSRQSG